VEEKPWDRGTERVSEKIARGFVSQPSVGCAKAASLGGLATAILVKGFSVSRSRVGISQSSIVGFGSTASAEEAPTANTTTIQRPEDVRGSKTWNRCSRT